MIVNKVSSMRITIDINCNDEEARIIKEYIGSMPTEIIINGLEFIYNRWKKEQDGLLKVGRKSKINNEINMITKEQARWRLDNWKIMIKNYREKGYSYPTIYRIKKALIGIANS
jgi:hypothetical protein